MFAPSVWDPFSSVLGFERSFEPHFRRVARAQSARQAPHIEVLETDDAFTLRVDVPGVSADAIQLELDDQILSLRADRERTLPEGYRAHRLERSTFSLAQRFTLPRSLDLDRLSATLQAGVLTVSLPKLAARGPRTIPVRTAPTPTEETAS